MVVDQFPEGSDLSRVFAKQHNFTIYDSIERAITLGRKEVAVDGVLLIGEHGKYPTNARGQVLYPRRPIFEETAAVFARYRRSVPVFTDKHLAATWNDAKWMYDRARELHVPFMAGSSVPVTWRRPVLRIQRRRVDRGRADRLRTVRRLRLPRARSHAMLGRARRRGGETGVRAVTCLQGEEMWRAMDRGVFSRAARSRHGTRAGPCQRRFPQADGQGRRRRRVHH